MDAATLSILVDNHFGVLTKVTGLFGRRGYNIKSLSVGETQDPSLSRITIQTTGDAMQLQQIVCQVRKLEEVHAAALLPKDGTLERELMLVKLRPARGVVGQLMQIATEQSCKCAAAGDSVILEASGPTARLNTLIELVRPFNIVELSRTGATALGSDSEPFVIQTQQAI